MSVHKVWIAGEWRAAIASGTFTAHNPATGMALDEVYPTSTWADCDAALAASVDAARAMREVPVEEIAAFLERYAAAIETSVDDIVAMAHEETGLPIKPRLRDVEIVRTLTQLRQAAAAALEGSWQQAVIDSKNNIRSHYAPIGPVVVFGPNNFPFAYNGVSGGDFAAAIATGCPVIAKSHPLHPGTSRLLAECASQALLASAALPRTAVQMLYNISNEDGLRLVADSRVGATGFTGSRAGGLKLKSAADAAGKVIYLEMSSLNPVVLLPGAIAERGEKLATELADSCLAASGQFCTSPNLIFAIEGEPTEKLAEAFTALLQARPVAPLLSEGGLKGLHEGVQWLVDAGATVVTGGAPAQGEGWRYQNTLLRISGEAFLTQAEKLQREAFGNATLLITAKDFGELIRLIETLEGSLTGSIYSSSAGSEDELYRLAASALRFRVGRLLNDKMPTGVALSPAMNHGGPFPATSHPGFTAVGVPRSLLRFGALHCYDNVREDRLPSALRDRASSTQMWRTIDGEWIRD